MPSAQVLDRHAGLGFAQEADDLLFGKRFFTSNLLGLGNGLQTEVLLKLGDVAAAAGVFV